MVYSINNKFKLNFHEGKAKTCFEELKTPDLGFDRKFNKSVIGNKGYFEDNLILYKKDVYRIDNSLSTEETFVLSKFPQFSCMPFSESDELDFENNDNPNNQTDCLINHMDISDLDYLNKGISKF